MIKLTINGLNVQVEEGSTILEASKFFGFPIPTLCQMEGLSPYGACRLCVVEIGEGNSARMVSSCTYPVQEGLQVRTSSARVVKARKMVLELLLASCPQSKIIQDLAAAQNVRQQRFRQEHEDCILCGLCTRMCEEQMMAQAIGCRGRGAARSRGSSPSTASLPTAAGRCSRRTSTSEASRRRGSRACSTSARPHCP